MKYLILSCNTGEGHNSAAKAIKQQFDTAGEYCEIVDALAFLSKESSKIISKGHTFVYKNLPKIFGEVYKFEENHPVKIGDDSLIYDIVTVGSNKLHKFLKKEKFDAVICVHVFAAMMMTKLRRTGKLTVPTYFVATDYTCSPGVNETDCDLYFIPHKDLIDEFVLCNLQREKLIPSGIPINEVFSTHTEKSIAKRKLHIKEDEKIVLLACGSIGCGPIKQLSEELPKSLPENTRLIVICGNNRKLYKSLYQKDVPENLSVVGYTTRMSLYMDAADIIITKAGGLSSTEAFSKALPIIFIDAVPGLETRNLEFFVSRGFAKTSSSVSDLAKTTCNLLNNPLELKKISKTMADNNGKSASSVIFEKIRKIG